MGHTTRSIVISNNYNARPQKGMRTRTHERICVTAASAGAAKEFLLQTVADVGDCLPITFHILDDAGLG